MTQATAVSIVALKTFPLFHGLSDDALANIARVAMMRRFPRGQSVVCAGDRPDYVYLVLTGSLKVVVSDEDGREVILSILGQGVLFGEMGMFDERPDPRFIVFTPSYNEVLASLYYGLENAKGLIGYGVAKPTAGQRVISLIDDRPKWKVVRRALLESGFGRMLLIITLLRLPPNSPFAITNLVLASVRVPIGAYVVGTLLGMAPRTRIVLYLAAQIREKFGEHATDAAKADKPWWFITARVVLSIVALAVIGFIANRALEKVTGEHKGVGIEAEE